MWASLYLSPSFSFFLDCVFSRSDPWLSEECMDNDVVVAILTSALFTPIYYFHHQIALSTDGRANGIASRCAWVQFNNVRREWEQAHVCQVIFAKDKWNQFVCEFRENFLEEKKAFSINNCQLGESERAIVRDEPKKAENEHRKRGKNEKRLRRLFIEAHYKWHN